MWHKFYYSEKGQRTLLTSTLEGGQRVSSSLVLSRPYILLPDPLPQQVFEDDRISQKVLKKEKHVLEQATLLH